jgi:uncharacterized protein (DUF2384 family)
MGATWVPTIDQLEPAMKPEILADVAPLLARIVGAYPQAVVARLLGVDRSAVTRWVQDDRDISAPMRARIVEVHDVLTRVHQVFNPILAARWLVGHEPFLGGARPIDVMGIRGAAPVIDALDAISSGGYA